MNQVPVVNSDAPMSSAPQQSHVPPPNQQQQVAVQLRRLTDEKKRLAGVKKELDKKYNELQTNVAKEMLKRNIRAIYNGNGEWWSLGKDTHATMSREHRIRFFSELMDYIRSLAAQQKPLPTGEQCLEYEKKFKTQFEERRLKLIPEKTRPKSGVDDLREWLEYANGNGSSSSSSSSSSSV